jgi:hypothetical protein
MPASRGTITIILVSLTLNVAELQVELLVTYEGSRLAINDLRLLMDTFHKPEFTGTWRRLFSRVKKHIIWGVLKSVTGMQASVLGVHHFVVMKFVHTVLSYIV